jgi:hypothetical protein
MKLKTPGKMPSMNILKHVRFDLRESVESMKQRLPNMPHFPAMPKISNMTPSMPDIRTPIKNLRMPKVAIPSKGEIKDGVKDSFTKYVLTKDAIALVLYAWLAIVLRNTYFPQQVHNWMVVNNPLSESG